MSRRNSLTDATQEEEKERNPDKRSTLAEAKPNNPSMRRGRICFCRSGARDGSVKTGASCSALSTGTVTMCQRETEHTKEQWADHQRYRSITW